MGRTNCGLVGGLRKNEGVWLWLYRSCTIARSRY